jgi:hypothetical protein
MTGSGTPLRRLRCRLDRMVMAGDDRSRVAPATKGGREPTCEPERHKDRQREQQSRQRQHGERADDQDQQRKRERENLDRECCEADDQHAGLAGEVGWGGRFGMGVHTNLDGKGDRVVTG